MTTTSKATNVALWIVSALLAGFFLAAGAAKLIGVFDEPFHGWGFPPEFPAMIGTIEIAGAFGLLFKRTAGWSSIALLAVVFGAAGIHLVHQDYMLLIAPAALTVALGLVAWGRGTPWDTRAGDWPGAGPTFTP